MENVTIHRIIIALLWNQRLYILYRIIFLLHYWTICTFKSSFFVNFNLAGLSNVLCLIYPYNTWQHLSYFSQENFELVSCLMTKRYHFAFTKKSIKLLLNHFASITDMNTLRLGVQRASFSLDARCVFSVSFALCLHRTIWGKWFGGIVLNHTIKAEE